MTSEKSTVYCKCGCGKKLTPYQIRKKGKYASKACEAKWKRWHNSEKYKLYARPNSKYSYLGEKECLNYNDSDLKCVMCYEQELFYAKECRSVPKKNENER